MAKNGNPLGVKLGDTIYWDKNSEFEAGYGEVIDVDPEYDDGQAYLVTIDGTVDDVWVGLDHNIYRPISGDEVVPGDKVRITDPGGNYMVGVVSERSGRVFKFVGGEGAHWWDGDDTDVYHLLFRPEQEPLTLDPAKLEANLRAALVNAANYPNGVGAHVLGTDMGKLIEAVTAAVKGAEV